MGWLDVVGPPPGQAAVRTASAVHDAGGGWQAQWAQARDSLGQVADSPRPAVPHARKRPQREIEPVPDGMPAPLQQRAPARGPFPDARLAAVTDRLARTEADSPPQLHVHIERGADGLHLWLGLPGFSPHNQVLLSELLARLRRDLQHGGQPLAAVTCNGQPLGRPFLVQEP